MNCDTRDICIVVHGPSDFVNFQKFVWRDYIDQVVFSTWAGEECKYEKKDIVIFNPHPYNSGINNINRQKIALQSGIDYAKIKNYSKILKFRSDQAPTNARLFLNNIKKNLFNVFLYHLHEDGYFTDYFMFGDLDIMEKIWSFDGTLNYKYPEYIITKNIIKFCGKNLFFYKDVMSEDNSVFSYKWNIDLYSSWKKNQSFLKTEEEVYKIIKKDHPFDDKSL